MADLSTLIRLHKHELDQKRLALANLHTALEALQRQQQALEESFAREKEAARQAEGVSFSFTTYAEKVRQQKEALATQRKNLEKQIAAAKDSMMETFSELKKYEMTQAERARLEAEERALKESKNLDDIGLEVFRRKSEE